MLKQIVICVGLATALGGCTQGLQYAMEAGQASKDYVDEKTDRREDLRMLEYQVEDSLIDMHMRLARKASDSGELEVAAEQYTKALERIDQFYPDIGSLRERVSTLRDEVTGE